VYLSTHQFIPQGRIQDFLKLFGVELSTGTLNNFRRKGAKELAEFEALLQQKVSQAEAAYFDETGMKVNGLNHWVHVASTKVLSWFGIHHKRGRAAHEAFGILPNFKGIAHRDSYRSYDDYPESRDSLCNAHISRELEFAIERDEQAFWAKPMLDLLLTIKKQVEARTDQVADLRWQGRHRRRYEALIELGLAHNPPAIRPDGQARGHTKQSKTYNLLIRLRDRQADVLRFMTDPLAEFTNNQAERDLRMNKVRAKVSGGFRALTPAQEFMRLRSLIHTAIKQAACPMEILVQLFTPGNTDYLNLVNPD
jgi:transposase